MIRTLIVDDEHVEREALELMIEKGIRNVRVVAQAENGKQAVREARKQLPDLILMDIQMPGMDGLEATRRILEFHPHAKFIIVSAYDTFEYARRAMQMGVRDYLLKPSKTEEILHIVEKVAAEIHLEKRKRAERAAEKERWRKVAPVVETDLVTQLLYEHTHETDVKELLPLFGIEHVHRAFVMLVYIQMRSGWNAAQAETIYKQIKTAFHRDFDGWVGALAGQKIPLVVVSDERISFRAQALIITRKLLSLCAGSDRIDLFIGIGGEYEKLKELRQSFYEALIASSHLDLPSRNAFYQDQQESGENAVFVEWEKEILEEARLGKFSSIERKLGALIDRHQACGMTISETQQRVLEALFMITSMLKEFGVQTETPIFSPRIRDFRVLRAETNGLVEKMKRAQAEMKERISPDLAQKVKTYIHQHAHERISLETVAAQVGMNPFYVSKWFKDTFGKNFVEYVTECRIEKAKQSMLDGHKTLKEIAIDVGYRDPNYFSRVFKKVCGISAKQFRQNLTGKT